MAVLGERVAGGEGGEGGRGGPAGGLLSSVFFGVILAEFPGGDFGGIFRGGGGVREGGNY